MFLSEVVKTSSAPIAEEQAWGLYYQGLKTLKAESQARAFSGLTNDGISFESIFLHKDGIVSFKTDTRNRTGQPKCKKMKYSDAVVLFDLGSAVYNALDYGIRPDEERILGKPLENLISMMITDYLDEGVGEENEAGLSKIDNIMKLCKDHLPRAVNADIFYQNVVGEMVMEVKQLSMVGCAWKDAGAESSRSTADPQMLQNWSEVTEEIRQGPSRLKRVDIEEFDENLRKSVLNPHENLMFSIRNQRQKLRKVVVNSLPRSQPTSTHDLTMQLIRTRPKLKSVRERHLNPTPPRRYSLRELFHKELLTRTAEWPTSEPRGRIPRKGRMSADQSLCGGRMNRGNTERKRLKIDNQLLRWNMSDERHGSATCSKIKSDWKSYESFTTNDMDWKLYDVEAAPMLSKRRLSYSDPDLTKRRLNDMETDTGLDSVDRNDPQVNLDEILHIRGTIVRAEVERVEAADLSLHAELVSGKVCFSCKKKFGFFGNKGSVCEFCERTVCSSCLNSTVLIGETAGVQGVGPRLPNSTPDSHVFSLTPLRHSPSSKIPKDKRLTHSFTDLSTYQDQFVSVRVCKDCSSLLTSVNTDVSELNSVTPTACYKFNLCEVQTE